MQSRRLTLIFFLTSVIAACADFYGGRPPAPVFGGQPGDNLENDPYLATPSPPETVQQPPQVIETKPLGGGYKAPEMIEIKPELPPPVETGQVPTQPSETIDPFGTEQPSETQNLPETEPPAEQPKPAEVVKPVAPPTPEIPKEPEPLVPLESFAPQSPAVGSLVMAANENSQGGKLDSAVASIERAIRIEPRNATLYYKLAVLRLKQSKPRLAEDLARKAALLAVNNNTLKKHSWLLIANARELQKNVAGAKIAKAEAAKY
ncbi:tetratricopeptide repeat protein [Methyloglobulus sp.]|uniref:tetratricopeptide repeat protein n=1 Tax=Methyloglobulus sp. TaxID=2518622 RepID=UPI003989B6BC